MEDFNWRFWYWGKDVGSVVLCVVSTVGRVFASGGQVEIRLLEWVLWE
jgi:hypothetical protein